MRFVPTLKLLLAGMLVAALSAGPALANPTLLFDLESGRIYAHQDAFKRWYPASLTKLMTAYVTYRAVANGELALDSPIRVSKHAAAEPPSKMGYKAGSVMTLDNALKMMLVKSANDIAMAIGENVGGSEAKFVERMNAEAARLGMTGTRYANPNGWFSPDQYTTARDQAILVTALRKEFPQHSAYFTIEGLQAGKTKFDNFNLLVGRYKGADGMKTGFVCESGFNMIGSATRDGRTLVAIALGQASATERAEAVAALLDQGFAGSRPGADTVTTLARYGDDADMPANLRGQICAKPAPKQATKPASGKAAEEAGEKPLTKEISPYRLPFDHVQKLVKVDLGGATGPVPLARRGADGREVADVPIPTWRPDRPPPGFGAPIQGDAATAAGSGK